MYKIHACIFSRNWSFYRWCSIIKAKSMHPIWLESNRFCNWIFWVLELKVQLNFPWKSFRNLSAEKNSVGAGTSFLYSACYLLFMNKFFILFSFLFFFFQIWTPHTTSLVVTIATLLYFSFYWEFINRMRMDSFLFRTLFCWC